ncbi:MAG: TMEM165/GDT1 family protein [Acidobacteriota bacterium]|nr:TMEM165/GDT1 family protein [Acidobacteriota bacterium]
MTPFWIALSLVFVAEMGDKTQLVALAFATRYRAAVVLAGVLVATLVIHLGSVWIGEAAGKALPRFWIDLLAGAAFIGFGLWTLRGDELGDQKASKDRFGPFLTVATTFFLAELGDKTMLATVTIASQQSSFLGVWLGSSLGMVLADGLAIIVGQVMGKRLPHKLIQYGAALIFLASGVFTLVQAFRHR